MMSRCICSSSDVNGKIGLQMTQGHSRQHFELFSNKFEYANSVKKRSIWNRTGPKIDQIDNRNRNRTGRFIRPSLTTDEL